MPPTSGPSSGSGQPSFEGTLYRGTVGRLRGLPRPRRRVILFSGCVFLILMVGLADFLTLPELTFSVVYLIPVSLLAWYGGRGWGIFGAVLAASIWFASDHIQAPRISANVQLWNGCSRLAVFLFGALVICQVRRTKAGLEAVVRERTRNLQNEISQRLAVERQIAAISDREQRRIGHELHDGLGQHLAGVAFRAKALEQQLAAQNLPQAREAAELTGLVSDAIRQARLLARGLDPLELQNHDLVAALQGLAVETQKTFTVACVTNFLQAAPALRVNRQAGLAFYRICQEAVHNALTHGKAKLIQIELAVTEGQLVLKVSDDGCGFSPNDGPFSGMGLGIMRVRAGSIDGKLEIHSTPGGGAQVVCSVPIENTELTVAEQTEEAAP